MLVGMANGMPLTITVGGISLSIEGAPRFELPPELVHIALPALAFMVAPRAEGDHSNGFTVRLAGDLEISLADERCYAPNYSTARPAIVPMLASVSPRGLPVQTPQTPHAQQLTASYNSASYNSLHPSDLASASLEAALAPIAAQLAEVSAKLTALKASPSEDLDQISKQLEALLERQGGVPRPLAAARAAARAASL